MSSVKVLEEDYFYQGYIYIDLVGADWNDQMTLALGLTGFAALSHFQNQDLTLHFADRLCPKMDDHLTKILDIPLFLSCDHM